MKMFLSGEQIIEKHGISPQMIFDGICAGKLTPFTTSGAQRIIDLKIPATLSPFSDETFNEKFRHPRNCKPDSIDLEKLKYYIYRSDEVDKFVLAEKALSPARPLPSAPVVTIHTQANGKSRVIQTPPYPKKFISVQVLAQQLERFQILRAVNDGDLTLYDKDTGDRIVDVDLLPREYLTEEEIERGIRARKTKISDRRPVAMPIKSLSDMLPYMRLLTENEISARVKLEFSSQLGTPLVPGHCKAFRFSSRSPFYFYPQMSTDDITDFLCDIDQAKAFIGIAEADKQPVKSLESGPYVEPVIQDQKEHEKDNPQSVPEYIEKRRKEGVKDEIIAVELKQIYKLSPYKIAHELGIARRYNAAQYDAIRKAGERLIIKGMRHKGENIKNG